MFDFMREMVYSDKIFDNPVLGKISCGAFSETYTACKQNNRRSKSIDPCVELKQVTAHCYSGKNKEEVNDWIMGEFHETLLLWKFLQEKNSTLPEKMGRNSWAVFSNKANLEKYEEVTRNKPKK